MVHDGDRRDARSDQSVSARGRALGATHERTIEHAYPLPPPPPHRPRRKPLGHARRRPGPHPLPARASAQPGHPRLGAPPPAERRNNPPPLARSRRSPRGAPAAPLAERLSTAAEKEGDRGLILPLPSSAGQVLFDRASGRWWLRDPLHPVTPEETAAMSQMQPLALLADLQLSLPTAALRRPPRRAPLLAARRSRDHAREAG